MTFEKEIDLRTEEPTYSIYLKPLLIEIFEVN